MTSIANTGLSEWRRTVIMRAGVIFAALLLLSLFADGAAAQQQQKRDDLDVTMQIIMDPDAKLPDEVVRRIPLPARKAAETSPAVAGSPSDKSGKERDDAANEHGKETSEAAQERARDAAEQRETARRAAAEEKKKREHGPPDRPDPPGRPPRN